MATISVVIPVYNRKDIVGRALDSVRRQTLAPDEIIVVDDGSTDGTGEFVAANYPEAKIFRQENQGCPAAKNTGIHKSISEYIAFLDSDDVWLPDKLSIQMQILKKHPDLGLLGTRMLKMQELPTSWEEEIPDSLPVIKRFHFTRFWHSTTIHASSVIIPRRVLSEVGLYNPGLVPADDWDLWARIAYKYPVARVERPLVAVEKMADSLSLRRSKCFLRDIEIMARWNPESLDSYDTEGRISKRRYRRHLVWFTVAKAAWLLKHEGPESVSSFIAKVENMIGLPEWTRKRVYTYLRLIGYRCPWK